MPEGYTKRPFGQGRGGPPESSGRGMQEERRRRTWEAPDVPAVENVGVWHTAPEAQKGKPGHGVKPEPKWTEGTSEQAGGEVLSKGTPAVCGWGVPSTSSGQAYQA